MQYHLGLRMFDVPEKKFEVDMLELNDHSPKPQSVERYGGQFCP